MSVDETYRGYGIATKLVAACEDWSRQAGCKTMGLYTINPVAAEFHAERMGYKSVESFYGVKNASGWPWAPRKHAFLSSEP